MSAALWFYVRRPEGGFAKLASKLVDALYRKEGTVDRALADAEGYMRTAELIVELESGVPTRVIHSYFNRVRVTKEGALDREHANLVGHRMISRLDDSTALDAKESREDVPGAFPGLVDASARFQRKRLDDLCTWSPSATDLEELGKMLGKRITSRGSARERNVAELQARSREYRQALAANVRAPRWALECLADDPDEFVRAAVAANRSVSSDVLAVLGGDESSAVVESVARNRSTSPEWLEGAAKDPREAVRVAAAGNPMTPRHMIERLAWADRSDDVKAAAQAQVDSSLEWAVGMARSEHASDYSLGHAARDRRPEVRLAVAERSSLANDLIALLADDPDARVRAAIARRAGVDDSRSLLAEPDRPGEPPRRPVQGNLFRRGKRARGDRQ
jgi:hypothetical protein